MSSDPLAARSRRTREGPALVDLGPHPTRLTWGDLDARAALWAHRLTSAGIQRGDRVAVAEPAGALLVSLLHACIRIGAVIAPLPARAQEAERERLIEQVRPRAVIRDGDVEFLDEGL